MNRKTEFAQANPAIALVIALVASLFVLVQPPEIAAASYTSHNTGPIVYNDQVCNLGDPASHQSAGTAFQISTPDELWEITDCVSNSATIYFELTSNIDVSQAVTAPTNSPIGYDASGDISFSGVLDGMDFSVTGISMSSSDYGVGLFAFLQDATIRNLEIAGSFTTATSQFSSYDASGALAIRSGGELNLYSISNLATVTGNGMVGGLVGRANNITITKSRNVGDITGASEVGGLVGEALGSAYLSASQNEGEITGEEVVGGLVGYAGEATVDTSKNTGDVNGLGPENDGYSAGGLLGDVRGDISINRSYNSGSVASRFYVGGLVGYVVGDFNSDFTYNIGSITGEYQVGGFVGAVEADANIRSSYMAGAVSGQIAPDGFIEYAGGTITTASAYSSVASNFVAVKTLGELKVSSTYLGSEPNFNFEDTWGFGLCDENQGLPMLRVLDEVEGYYTISCGDGGTYKGYTNDTAIEFYNDVCELGDPNTKLSTATAFKLSTVEQLYEVTDCLLDDATVHFALDSDIDFSQAVSAPTNYPIGDTGSARISFSGVLDGQNNKILGVSMNPTLGSGAGIFAYLHDATIRNLGIEGSFRANKGGDTSSTHSAGSLAVRSAGIMNLLSISNQANVSGANNVGGLVGHAAGIISITSSHNSGEIVSNGSRAGGLIGNSGESENLNVYASGNSGEVSGLFLIGGLVGRAGDNTTVIASYNEGDVTAPFATVGGLIGDVYLGDVSFISSRNTAHISGSRDVGGLVGHGWHSADIDSSYNTGTVSGTLDHVGGLVGHLRGDIDIDSSYNTGAVSGAGNASDYVGGLVGNVYRDVDMHSSYNEGDVVGQQFVGGLIGRVRGAASATASHNIGGIQGSSLKVGGLIGGVTQDVNLHSSYNEGNVTGSGEVGGLVGEASEGEVNVSYSSNSGNVRASYDFAGGLIGLLKAQSKRHRVNFSSNTGQVSSFTGKYLGGLLGQVTNQVTIAFSYNEGEVAGKSTGHSTGEQSGSYVGGLVGWPANKAIVDNSYNSGPISGNESVGGLVGFTRYFETDDSYNTGAVTGVVSVGGILGAGGVDTKIRKTFNTGVVSGDSNVDGLAGSSPQSTTFITDAYSSVTSRYVTTTAIEDMRLATTFENFDFRDVWGFGACGQSSDDLPMLRQLGQVANYFNQSCGSSVNYFKYTNDAAIDFNNQVCDLGNPNNHSSSATAFQISTTEQLWEITDCVSSSANIHFEITADIDVSQAQAAPIGSPIGYSNSSLAYSFSGVLDGNDHLISGISMTANDYGVGLFAYLHDADISNLAISGSFVTTTTTAGPAQSAGALAIRADGSLDLVSIHNQANVTGTRDVGGLVGYVNSDANIESSSNTGTISASGHFAGGLAGRVIGTSNIDNSFNAGFVSGTSHVGGLLGRAFGLCDTDFSFNTGAVSGSGQGVGGLVGSSISTFNTSVHFSYNTGPVSGTEVIGGLVGYIFSDARIAFSYNAGTVTGNEDLDGLVGFAVRSQGDVTTNSAYSSVASRYIPTTPENQMRVADTYIGFDFDDDWGFGTLNDNQGFPMLRSFGELTSYLSDTSIPSSDSSLVSLAISDGSLSPSFGSETTSYSVSVQHSVTSITLTPIKSEQEASITVNGVAVSSGAASGAISLSVGSNTITVVVTAEDQTTTTYTLTITRQPGTAQTPSFETPTKTNDGFTVQISNHNEDFTWAVSATVGSANIDQSGLVTVTGVGPGASSTITITSTRTDYSTGQASIASQALNAARTPAFETPTKTNDGFTVQISNHNEDFTWAVSATVGSASIDQSGLVTVTGVGAGVSSTITVTTTRADYVNGTASTTSSAIYSTFNNMVCDLGDPNNHSTSATAFEISDEDELWEITDCVSSSTTIYFKLMNDIAIPSGPFDGAETDKPIGYRSSGYIEFNGVLDGQNFEVSGLSMSSSVHGVGLFAYLHNATISNLVISGAISTTANTDNDDSAGALAIRAAGNVYLASISNQATVLGSSRVGGLIGHVSNDVTIVSSQNGGAVSGSQNVGGLVGYVFGNAHIESSYNSGTVSATTNHVGGLVGYVHIDANITSSHNTGPVSGERNVGGLVGQASTGNANIDSSYNSGTVSGTATWTGGLVGYVHEDAKISSSYNTGAVSGAVNVGGLVGLADEANIDTSYNIGAVSGTTNAAGGLVGYVVSNANIASSSNSGTVSGTAIWTGGLVGFVENNASIASSKNTSPVSGSHSVGGLLGYVNNNVNISLSHNTGAITSTDNDVGGLVGYVKNDANIDLSYNSGSVFGKAEVGGLVGQVAIGNANVEFSENTGPVSGSYQVGGLLGYVNNNANISSSQNTGEITGTGSVGGLAGYVRYDPIIISSSNSGTVSGLVQVGGLIGSVFLNITITSSFNVGTVVGGNGYAGGLVGNVYNGFARIAFSFNSGSITGAHRAGGLLGSVVNSSDVTITSSYNIGAVSGTFSVGGFVGEVLGGNVSIVEAYNTGTLSGSGNSFDGFVGFAQLSVTTTSAYSSVDSDYVATKSVQDMRNTDTYIGFDFDDVWGFGTLNDNQGFPMLRSFGELTSYLSDTSIPSSDSSLVSLAISDGSLSPSFGSETTSYSVSVQHSVTSITLTPTKSEQEASITVNGVAVSSGAASGAISLSVGSNTITVVVTAEDQTTTTYTLTVTRQPGTAQTPSFGTPTKTSDGFTVQISNHDEDFTWAASATVGSVAISSTGSVTLTGVGAGASSTITITSTRTDYSTGQASITSEALNAARTPTFETPTKTNDGFTVQISNHNEDFTWAVSATVGSASIDQSGLVTVTGVGAGVSSTITVTTTRADYVNGTASTTSSAIDEARTPTFAAPTGTNDGFTVEISNYDGAFSWTASASSGTVSISSMGVVELTGLNSSTSSTITITATRAGYQTGTASITGSSLDTALVPVFGTQTRTSDGFTNEISNYDPDYIWTAFVDNGAASIDSNGLVTVSGVGPGGVIYLTVEASRTGYAVGSEVIMGLALDAALEPSIQPPTATEGGFTIQIDNYNDNPNATWSATASAGSVSIDSNGLLEVTGLAAGAFSEVTITTRLQGHANGSSTFQGFALDAATTPTFDAPTRTNGGFTVQISNYDPNYTWSASASVGAVTISPTGLVSVTGVGAGVVSNVTVSASVDGFSDGEASITSSALDSALTPTFATPTRTNDGFTVQISNHDGNFSWAASATVGSANIDQSGLVTVTGVGAGASSTITITTTRTDYSTGQASITSEALNAARTPTFATPTKTTDGFTVNISNYDGAFSWNLSVSNGSASVDSNGLITLTGIAAGASSVVTLTTSRAGYANGTASVTGAAIDGALTPTFATPTRTNDGFTVEISNYVGDFTWAASATLGTVSIGSGGTVVLTGLSPSTSSTITITATRAGYATGTASITSSSLDTALTPTFGAATSTSEGFTVNISNYDGAFSWNLSASNGSVSVDSNGLITLTGIAAGASSVVTLTTTRVGFVTGTAQTSGSALNAALLPSFAAATRTNDGFTVQLSNYDANFTWTLTASTGSASVDSNGLISVTGVGTGLSSTLTIATSRNGHANASTQITSSAIDAALTPAIAAPARTGSGFTALISNYDPNFSWAIAATLGAASIDANGLLTVVGLSPSSSSTVTVTTTRTGFASGTASVAGTSLDAALTPIFDASTRSSDGFVVQLSNYDPNYTWTANATAGTVSISGSGFVVVAGLSAGAASTITITTTKAGHAQGVATLTQNAIGAATTQTPSTPTPAYSGPVIDSPKSVRAGNRVTFFGSRLDTITAVHVGGIKLVMVAATENSIVLEVKVPVLAGTHDLVLESSFGTLTFQNGITILGPETQIVAEATPEAEDIQKLTVGSFRGFIAIYTKGYEGQRLSAKVAGKWLVVESLDESFKGNDHSRTVRRTGSGYSIKVHLYIDREFVRTEELTTR